ncbi:MAG: hypothetical protein J0I06_17170 [Planctomycetes bacterium]|nr:hypothetical protein [Planctomycetota bacterium]
MNHSTKKQLHEKNRKRHKQEMQAHAREAARRGRSTMPMWFLAGGLVVIVAAVLMISFR